jgi:hypothetical protein
MQGLEFVTQEVQRFKKPAHGSWHTAHGLKDRHQAYCVRNGYRVKGIRYRV